jgi:hypothetical protein
MPAHVAEDADFWPRYYRSERQTSPDYGSCYSERSGCRERGKFAAMTLQDGERPKVRALDGTREELIAKHEAELKQTRDLLLLSYDEANDLRETINAERAAAATELAWRSAWWALAGAVFGAGVALIVTMVL